MSSHFATNQEIKTPDRASDMTEWVNLGMVQLLVVKSAGLSEINSHWERLQNTRPTLNGRNFLRSRSDC